MLRLTTIQPLQGIWRCQTNRTTHVSATVSYLRVTANRLLLAVTSTGTVLAKWVNVMNSVAVVHFIKISFILRLNQLVALPRKRISGHNFVLVTKSYQLSAS